MKTRYFLLVVAFLLIGISGFVIAEVSITTYIQNEKGQARDFVYGSTSDKPYLRSTFNIYKGWNLVPVGVKEPSRARNTFVGYGERVLGCSLDESFSTWQIKYQYDYIPGKGYIGGELNYNTGDLKEPKYTEVGNIIRDYYFSPEMGGNEGQYSYLITSHWFYSEIDCSFPAGSSDIKDASSYQGGWLDKVKLSKGWNLISITHVFLDEKLGDSLGNCKVLKVNQWNPVKQKWEYSSSESEQEVSNLLNKRIGEEDLYVPLVIKVENNCHLGQSSTQPPAIPN